MTTRHQTTSAAPAPVTVDSGAEPGIDDAMQMLSRLGSDLLESYQALAQRAEYVEEQLCRTNEELGRKLNELDAVNRHLAAILDALPTGVIVRDDAGRVVRVNDAALEALGVGAEELLGTTQRTYATEDSADAGDDGWKQSEVSAPTGERRVLASRRSPIARGTRVDGTPTDSGSVEILDDRTRMVELSERLHSLDKLAALGNMAGGIAHEIRNPMNAIKGFAALLYGKLERGTKEHSWSGLIVEGVSESERILSSMLTLARPDGLVPESIDGSELVAAAVELALGDAEDAQRWQVTSTCSGPRFRGDRIKLRQALRNLIANALDAQPEGGRVHVALDVTDDVRVTVSDAGPGVPAELRTRVLDPFFTTRAQGTGLGLALVSKIAEMHGGHLDLSASSGSLGGAEFSIRFPSRTAA